MNPVAVGVDLVPVGDIRRALERTPTLARRVFTDGELAYAHEARDPSQRLAARWAAKEAVVKCLGGGVPGIDLRTIEVVRGADGAPSVALTGEAAERAADRGITAWLLSMTHTDDLAEAVAIALGR